jgi:hypothetical protein
MAQRFSEVSQPLSVSCILKWRFGRAVGKVVNYHDDSPVWRHTPEGSTSLARRAQPAPRRHQQALAYSKPDAQQGYALPSRWHLAQCRFQTARRFDELIQLTLTARRVGENRGFCLSAPFAQERPGIASVSLLPEFCEFFLEQVATLQRRIESEAAFQTPSGVFLPGKLTLTRLVCKKACLKETVGK